MRSLAGATERSCLPGAINAESIHLLRTFFCLFVCLFSFSFFLLFSCWTFASQSPTSGFTVHVHYKAYCRDKEQHLALTILVLFFECLVNMDVAFSCIHTCVNL